MPFLRLLPFSSLFPPDFPALLCLLALAFLGGVAAAGLNSDGMYASANNSLAAAPPSLNVVTSFTCDLSDAAALNREDFLRDVVEFVANNNNPTKINTTIDIVLRDRYMQLESKTSG
mmetsp:Transcript_12450/g.14936  ORF Transcript_12450/g.14936 Transcript_12450/m.14936 type:complete len:117 (-) Transcript_12450:8-358(-)